MNQILKIFLLHLILSVGFIIPCLAQMALQTAPVRIGEPCPDFRLTDIHDYPSSQAELKDFKGKWVVLDFWNIHCGTCVGSFPKINALQKQFKGKVQFIMVGMEGNLESEGKLTPTDKDHQIRKIYAQYKEKEHLEMAYAFDSTVSHQFDVGACPYVIVVDNNGIVQAVTYGVNAEVMNDFLAGGHPILKKAYSFNESDNDTYDPNRPFLLNGNGGNDSSFLFRSIISAWNPTMPISIPNGFLADSNKSGKFQALGVDLNMLFNYAYFGAPTWWYGDSAYGKYYLHPIINTRDSIAFTHFSSITGKNLFCYSQTIKAETATSERMQQIMQQELANYFGYKVYIETRAMPCLVLRTTAEDKDHLISKKGNYQVINSATGFIAKNYPLSTLILQMGNVFAGIIIINDTGITGNIDIDFTDCLFGDRTDLTRCLKRNGLILEEGVKEMKVITINDK